MLGELNTVRKVAGWGFRPRPSHHPPEAFPSLPEWALLLPKPAAPAPALSQSTPTPSFQMLMLKTIVPSLIFLSHPSTNPSASPISTSLEMSPEPDAPITPSQADPSLECGWVSPLLSSLRPPAHASPETASQRDPVKSKSGHAPALLKTFQWLPSHTGQGQSPYGGPKFLHALLPRHSHLTSLLPSLLLPQLYRIPDVPQTHCLIHRSYLECSPPADPHGSHLPLLQVLAQRSPPQRRFP